MGIKRLRTEDVGIMVQDGIERRWVETTSGHCLLRPRMGCSIVDIYTSRVGSVSSHHIDSVGELNLFIISPLVNNTTVGVLTCER